MRHAAVRTPRSGPLAQLGSIALLAVSFLITPAHAVSVRTLATFTGGYGHLWGSSVSGAGDVNGDGYADLIVGGIGSGAGRAWVYFGGPSVDVRSDLAYAGHQGGEHFGISVSNAGDMNGDGFNDIIVGARYNHAAGFVAGRAYVYYGVHHWQGPPVPDLVLTGEAAYNEFGWSVSGAGDVNGDGFPDVIVGAYGSDTIAPNAGRAYVYYGSPAADEVADLTLSGQAAGDFFGRSVSGAGDVNGDGFDDVIVGAAFDNAGGGGSGAGRAYIYFGGPQADAVADVTLVGEAPVDRFGSSVSGAGDVNGDGFADVIVGAEYNDAGGLGAGAGRAYVFHGGPGMDDVADLTLTGEAAGNLFGSSVSDAGDVNGDGFADVIVGARMYDIDGSNVGRAYVYFGGPAADAIADFVLTGELGQSASFGHSVSGAGDVVGDGFDDVIVGAPSYFHNGEPRGRAYLFDAHIPAVVAQLDVEPGLCPSILNIRSEGVTPVALLGSGDFNVADVDITTLELEGVAPMRSEVKDVGAALVAPEECECSTDGPDGWLDLRLEFSTRVLATAIGAYPRPAPLPLKLTGKLADGTPLEAMDCVRVIADPETLRLVVRADGSGDVPTIQEAIDWLALHLFGEREIILMPGYYDEEVQLKGGGRLLCPGGYDVTQVRGFSPIDDWPRWEIHGLTITEGVQQRGSLPTWDGCRFVAGYYGNAANRPNLANCEFRGPVRLVDYHAQHGRALEGLRFVGAPLYVRGDDGVSFKRCTFEGPVDTAVVVHSTGDSFVAFEHCTFENANAGIAWPAASLNHEIFSIVSCTFRNVGTAITNTNDAPLLGGSDWTPYNYFNINDSRFEDCGTAIRLSPRVEARVYLGADTVLRSRGNALELQTGRLRAGSLYVAESAGAGMVFRPRGEGDVQHSAFINNGGDGMVLVDSVAHLDRNDMTFDDNVFVGNGGHGARVLSRLSEWRGNVFTENAGDGLNYTSLRVDPTLPQSPGSIRENTSTLNGENGLSYSAVGTFPDHEVLFENNLAVGNEGVGIHIADALLLPPIGNDAWLNAEGNYAGEIDEEQNLQLDPRFCNVYTGDYTVQESSPCAPSGSYGQIGAFGVGCTSSHVELVARRGQPPPNATGQLKVGLLGHRLFDPTSVDMASVTLGGAPPSSKGGNQKGMQFRDVNQDGIMDGVLAFRGEEVAVTLAGEATFSGTTVGGSALSGGIEVREVGRDEEPLIAGQDFKLAIRSITPNPSHGRFLIEFTTPGGSAVELSFYDVAGRRVRTAALDHAAGVRRIEVSGLTPGVYFGVMKVGSESVRKRVVVR